MNQSNKHPLYFIAILPPLNIRNEIRSFKEGIKNDFGVKHALKLPAHITVQIPFRISGKQDTVLLERLKAFSNELISFEVALDGFGRFSKNVIFVNVLNHLPFIKVHSKLQEMLTSFIDLKSHEISSKIHPHLTIAVRDLKRSDFPAIWNRFETKKYNNSFTAKDLTLLKHNGHTWDVIECFNFKENS